MKCLTRSALRHAPTLARRVKTQLRPHSARPYAISPPKQTCEQYASKHRATTQPCTTSQRIRKQGPRCCRARRCCYICKMLCAPRPSRDRRNPRPRRESLRAHIHRSLSCQWKGLARLNRSPTNPQPCARLTSLRCHPSAQYALAVVGSCTTNPTAKACTTDSPTHCHDWR